MSARVLEITVLHDEAGNTWQFHPEGVRNYIYGTHGTGGLVPVYIQRKDAIALAVQILRVYGSEDE